MSQSDFVSRGQALVAAGQFQEAVKVCRLGLLGRPTTVEGRVVLGQALLALKRFDEVLAEMRVALELDQTSIPAQVLKGEALLRKGDTSAAIEALHKARQAAPGDPRILQLLAQAESAATRAPSSASHPSVGFLGSDTKHYPNHSQGEEDSGGSFTQPTSLQAPGAMKRSSQRRAAIEPSPDELAVGDRSGTVEVDPELEGVEVEDDGEFDDLAAPPVAARPGKIGGSRGSVRASRSEEFVRSRPTIDLDDESENIEMSETRLPASRAPAGRAKLPGPGTAVRNAVGRASGPIDDPEPPPRAKPPTGPPRTKPASAPPPPLVQALAAQARVKHEPLPPPAPLPPAPGGVPRLAAALPTVAAAPMPHHVPLPSSLAAAARPTVAVPAPPPPGGVELFGGGGGTPMWAQQTVPAPLQDPRSLAAANEPTMRPSVVDPAFAAMYAIPDSGQLGVAPTPAGASPRTGMRRNWSKLQIAMWVVIGVVVIAGGVFAGFQIRAMRLQRQIAEKQDRAIGVAKADTWTAWSAARDNLAQIVGASDSTSNRAALAKARALIAFEFADGAADAKSAVDDLSGQGGLDGDVAAAYIALAQGDSKGAKLAADAALSASSQDPTALYVAGRAALLGGDAKSATTYLREAYQHDARPLYGVGLASALAASYSWDEALGTLDRVLAASQDHPAAVIERARILAQSGRILPNTPAGLDLHTQVEKVVAEGSKPVAEQPHGVSPAQVAFANLALARVDYARGDAVTARGDLKAAASVGIDDVRFAEEAIDTLVTIGDLAPAQAAAERALQAWPQSRRARVALAEVQLANGRPGDALATLDKPEIATLPLALAVRGQARLANGDDGGARGDFDTALKKQPNLEPAIVGRAWLELQEGDVDEARKLVEPHVSATAGATPAMATLYAAVLRESGDAAAREKAKTMLEKVVAGPPGVDVTHAQLELARLDRDLGDFHGARLVYAEAAKSGSFDARVESGLLLIEDRDPAAGHDALEALLKEQGEHATGNLAIEVARARMLVGDNTGAQALLDAVTKTGTATKWKLERERGRLALRKGDFAGAVASLGKALDACGSDAETFLLAADAATSDDKGAAALAAKVKKLAPDRLKGLPEASIVHGKLLIVDQKFSEAIGAFVAARDALAAAKGTPRRQAQAHFGLGVAKYYNGDDAEADNELQLVNELDPSLATAFQFRASLLQDKQRKTAFGLVKRAVELDPDSLDSWLLEGQLATKLGDKKTFTDALAKLSALAPTSEQYKKLAALRR